jgi:hypothetical protein
MVTKQHYIDKIAKNTSNLWNDCYCLVQYCYLSNLCLKTSKILGNVTMYYSVKVPCNVLFLQTWNKHSQTVHWMDNQIDQFLFGVFLAENSVAHWCFHSNGWSMIWFDERVEIPSSLRYRWAWICVVCNVTFKTESHSKEFKNCVHSFFFVFCFVLICSVLFCFVLFNNVRAIRSGKVK